MPADGEVYAGSSHVDESMLTGESLPVPKQAGSTVIGGTMNLGGMIQVSPTPLPAVHRTYGSWSEYIGN